MIRVLILFACLLLMAFVWACVPARTHADLDAARATAETEFAAWLATPETQKLITERKLAGDYVYTIVIDHRGLVQTVYADENPDSLVMARQNEMTRLLRSFTSSIRLAPNERVKFQPRFKV